MTLWLLFVILYCIFVKASSLDDTLKYACYLVIAVITLAGGIYIGLSN